MDSSIDLPSDFDQTQPDSSQDSVNLVSSPNIRYKESSVSRRIKSSTPQIKESSAPAAIEQHGHKQATSTTALHVRDVHHTQLPTPTKPTINTFRRADGLKDRDDSSSSKRLGDDSKNSIPNKSNTDTKATPCQPLDSSTGSYPMFDLDEKDLIILDKPIDNSKFQTLEGPVVQSLDTPRTRPIDLVSSPIFPNAILPVSEPLHFDEMSDSDPEISRNPKTSHLLRRGKTHSDPKLLPSKEAQSSAQPLTPKSRVNSGKDKKQDPSKAADKNLDNENGEDDDFQTTTAHTRSSVHLTGTNQSTKKPLPNLATKERREHEREQERDRDWSQRQEHGSDRLSKLKADQQKNDAKFESTFMRKGSVQQTMRQVKQNNQSQDQICREKLTTKKKESGNDSKSTSGEKESMTKEKKGAKEDNESSSQDINMGEDSLTDSDEKKKKKQKRQKKKKQKQKMVDVDNESDSEQQPEGSLSPKPSKQNDSKGARPLPNADHQSSDTQVTPPKATVRKSGHKSKLTTRMTAPGSDSASESQSDDFQDSPRPPNRDSGAKLTSKNLPSTPTKSGHALSLTIPNPPGKATLQTDSPNKSKTDLGSLSTRTTSSESLIVNTPSKTTNVNSLQQELDPFDALELRGNSPQYANRIYLVSKKGQEASSSS
ncbi:hypothetical protein BGW38_002642, partial [Lunasporangiospora selenospora]